MVTGDRFTDMTNAARHITLIVEDAAVAKCTYAVMGDEHRKEFNLNEFYLDSRGNKLINGDEYFIITCKNGYRYYVNVSWDSILTACAQVFNFIQYKL